MVVNKPKDCNKIQIEIWYFPKENLLPTVAYFVKSEKAHPLTIFFQTRVCNPSAMSKYIPSLFNLKIALSLQERDLPINSIQQFKFVYF